VEKLEEIYREALRFVERRFPNIDPKEKRITVLSVMKMLLGLLRHETLGESSQVEDDISRIRDHLGEDYTKVALIFDDEGNVSEILRYGWLKKEEWSRINEKLKKIGYKWVSEGEKSRWVKERC